jgi:hypothetical protein
MDPERMPSERAEAARQKSAEIMASLKKGEPGDADKLMGDRKEKSSKNLLQKLGLGGKKKESREGDVVR